MSSEVPQHPQGSADALNTTTVVVHPAGTGAAAAAQNSQPPQQPPQPAQGMYFQPTPQPQLQQPQPYYAPQQAAAYPYPMQPQQPAADQQHVMYVQQPDPPYAHQLQLEPGSAPQYAPGATDWMGCPRSDACDRVKCSVSSAVFGTCAGYGLWLMVLGIQTISDSDCNNSKHDNDDGACAFSYISGIVVAVVSFALTAICCCAWYALYRGCCLLGGRSCCDDLMCGVCKVTKIVDGRPCAECLESCEGTTGVGILVPPPKQQRADDQAQAQGAPQPQMMQFAPAAPHAQGMQMSPFAVQPGPQAPPQGIAADMAAAKLAQSAPLAHA